MDSRREARILGISLATIYIVCLVWAAFGMN
jgi:hypothetical protein